MQLKALHLGAMALACAVLLAAALPAPHAAAQTTDDAAISSEREAAQVRIQRAVLNIVMFLGDEREREIRGLRSMYGSSALQDFLESQIAWIEEIESGDPRIMYETALRLRDGDGLPQHRDAAVTWLERAGDHGVPEGLFEASRMLLAKPFRDGDVLRSDDLLTRAARTGVAAAQKELARQLASGGARPFRRDRVRERKYREAYIWLLLAHANGAGIGDLDASSKKFLPDEERETARAIVARAVGRNLPLLWPAIEGGAVEHWWDEWRIAVRWEECDRAISILTGAAQAGETRAELELARSYRHGVCVATDAAKGLAHNEAAARSGDMRAILLVGFMYYDGRGAPKDLQKARHWFKAAALNLIALSPRQDRRTESLERNLPGADAFRARTIPPELAAEIEWLNEIERGDPRVMYATAVRLRDGDGLPQHREAAVALLRLAAKRGVMEANYDLGVMLLDAPRDYLDTADGIRALIEAGDNRFVPAQVELGRRYATGDGVRRWDRSAYGWLLMAEDNGADVAALLEEVGGRLSEDERRSARADAERRSSHPLRSR